MSSLFPNRGNWFKHILFHDFKLTCKTYIHTITIYRIGTKAESLCGSFPSFGLEIEYTILQARRHVFKSGPAEVRASAEGTSGGEHERG